MNELNNEINLTININVVADFNSKPYGRTEDKDGKASGETFRKQLLTPAMKKGETVVVDLTGYNRYGRSFLDEAFGGLIREDGFTQKDMDRLKYHHDDVKAIEEIISERIEAAIRDMTT